LRAFVTYKEVFVHPYLKMLQKKLWSWQTTRSKLYAVSWTDHLCHNCACDFHSQTSLSVDSTFLFHFLSCEQFCSLNPWGREIGVRLRKIEVSNHARSRQVVAFISLTFCRTVYSPHRQISSHPSWTETIPDEVRAASFTEHRGQWEWGLAIKGVIFSIFYYSSTSHSYKQSSLCIQTLSLRISSTLKSIAVQYFKGVSFERSHVIVEIAAIAFFSESFLKSRGKTSDWSLISTSHSLSDIVMSLFWALKTLESDHKVSKQLGSLTAWASLLSMKSNAVFSYCWLRTY